MAPKLPRLPRISEHLPGTTPLQEVFRDARESIQEMRQEIRTVANVIRIGTPRSMAAPVPTQPEAVKAKADPLAAAGALPEAKECKPCVQMRELQEVIGRRKVKKALDNLKAGQGDKEKDVETLRKYVEGEDV